LKEFESLPIDELLVERVRLEIPDVPLWTLQSEDGTLIKETLTTLYSEPE